MSPLIGQTEHREPSGAQVLINFSRPQKNGVAAEVEEVYERVGWNTPRPATNSRPDRSTITGRASSGAGRSGRQRILRCRPSRTLL